MYKFVHHLRKKRFSSFDNVLNQTNIFLKKTQIIYKFFNSIGNQTRKQCFLS